MRAGNAVQDTEKIKEAEVNTGYKCIFNYRFLSYQMTAQLQYLILSNTLFNTF